jgi:hypothetical protein
MASAPEVEREAMLLADRLAVVTTTYAVRHILDLVPHPWLLESGDLDTALEVVHNRSPAP